MPADGLPSAPGAPEGAPGAAPRQEQGAERDLLDDVLRLIKTTGGADRGLQLSAPGSPLKRLGNAAAQATEGVRNAYGARGRGAGGLGWAAAGVQRPRTRGAARSHAGARDVAGFPGPVPRRRPRSSRPPRRAETLRHALKDPQDAAAQMCGGLMSKE
jgi:hypothetical protein